jgi:hypothetical protein
MPKEREIKEYFLKMLKSIGALARKIKYENRNGCPDWIVFYHGGMYLVELKSDKGKLSYIQGKERDRIATHSIEVEVLYTYEDVDDFIEMIDA